MITLSTIIILLAIHSHYLVIKECKRLNISYNPLNCGYGIWMYYWMFNVISIVIIVILFIKYLP